MSRTEGPPFENAAACNLEFQIGDPLNGNVFCNLADKY